MYCSGKIAVVNRAMVGVDKLLGVVDRSHYGLEADRGSSQEIHDALEHKERLSDGRE